MIVELGVRTAWAVQHRGAKGQRLPRNANEAHVEVVPQPRGA